MLLVAQDVNADFKWEARGIASRVSYEFDVIFNLHIYSRAAWELQRARQNTLWRNVEREGIALSFALERGGDSPGALASHLKPGQPL